MRGDEYLFRLKLHLFPLTYKLKVEVLREISSHIKEAERRGGEEEVVKTLSRFGPPKKLALNYIRIWGVSPLFHLILGVLGLVLGTLSAPVKVSWIGIAIPPTIYIALYLMLLFIILYTGYRYGITPGGTLGVLGGIGFLSNVLLSYDIYGSWVRLNQEDLITISIISVLLPLTGFISGWFSEKLWEMEIEGI